MAKFTDVGYVAKGSKKNPKKPYIKVTNDVKLRKGQYLSLSVPRQGKEQSEDEYQEMLGWMKYKITLVEDDEPGEE